MWLDMGAYTADRPVKIAPYVTRSDKYHAKLCWWYLNQTLSKLLELGNRSFNDNITVEHLDLNCLQDGMIDKLMSWKLPY